MTSDEAVVTTDLGADGVGRALLGTIHMGPNPTTVVATGLGTVVVTKGDRVIEEEAGWWDSVASVIPESMYMPEPTEAEIELMDLQQRHYELQSFLEELISLSHPFREYDPEIETRSEYVGHRAVHERKQTLLGRWKKGELVDVLPVEGESDGRAV